jgi:uncharacterized membrane protein YciS (DUF1049 family)
MRLISLIFLVAVVVVVVTFVMQNDAEVTVHFFNYALTTTMAKLVGAAVAAGMIGGWSIVGLLRRSWTRVTEPGSRQVYQGR